MVDDDDGDDGEDDVVDVVLLLLIIMMIDDDDDEEDDARRSTCQKPETNRPRWNSTGNLKEGQRFYPILCEEPDPDNKNN